MANGEKNNRLDPGIGDLNETVKPYTGVTFDQADTTVMGTLNSMMNNQYKSKVFQNVGLLKGIVLRVEEASDMSANSIWAMLPGFTTKPLKQLKVRIPEIHAALPQPSLYGDVPTGPHQRIIDLYPTFTAADEAASKEDIAVSDIVVVDFADKDNFTQPVYIKKFADGPGSAGDTSPSNNGIYYRNKSNEGRAAFNNSNGLHGTGNYGCGGSSAPPSNTPYVKGCEGSPGGYMNASAPGGKLLTTAVGASKLQRAQNVVAAIKAETGIGLSVRLLFSFMEVESGGKTATKNTVRFEPHIFLGMYGPSPAKRSGKKGTRPDLYGGPRYTGNEKIPYESRYNTKNKQEWAGHRMNKKKFLKGRDFFLDKNRSHTNRSAFDRAFKLDPAQAIKATSWGQYQVMGWALLRAYGNDPHKAIAAYDANPMTAGDQMIVMWFKSNFRSSWKRKAFTQTPPDFDAMVKVYNGSAQVKSYSPKLRKFYAKFSDIPEAPTSSPETPPPTNPPGSTTVAASAAATFPGTTNNLPANKQPSSPSAPDPNPCAPLSSGRSLTLGSDKL